MAPRTGVSFIVGALIALAFGCSKSTPTTPSALGCTTGPTSTTLVISNNAVCPQSITVPRGTQVTFVNQDAVAHEMSPTRIRNIPTVRNSIPSAISNRVRVGCQGT